MARIYSKFQLLDLLGSSKIEQSANCEQQDNLRGREMNFEKFKFVNILPRESVL